MFEGFDFSVLDNPSFKEDSVREELVAPILREVGYGPSGEMRVTRSKALAHPFVMIGSRKHPVSIIPDYTLYMGDTPLLVLDAKGPLEPIVKSRHVEQVYSYAIHPEIRARHYALCNGRELVVYLVENTEPLLRIPIPEVDSRWAEVVEALHPRYLQEPGLRGFLPDYGLTMLQLGFEPHILHVFVEHYLQDMMRVADGLFTASATTKIGSLEYLVSFDFSLDMYDALLAMLPSEVAHTIRQALSKQPFRISLRGEVVLSCEGYLGEVTTGQFESFVSVRVSTLKHARYDPTVMLVARNPAWPKNA